MKDKALKLALETLEQTLQTLDDENAKPGGAIADTIWHSEHETLFDYLGSEITAIKEALAQPAQEPVGFVDSKLNPIQRPWVDLTEDQIKVIEEMALTKQWAIRMTIAAVKEKNT